MDDAPPAADPIQLSKHFTLDDLTFSQIALRHGIDNRPSEVQIANLTRLCVAALEPTIDIIGVVPRINSGFRCQLVNTLVGSTSKHSAHLDGRAADIVFPGIDLKKAFDSLRFNLKGFDQIILECGAWIHIAVADPLDRARGESLLASGTPGNWKYSAVA